MGFLPKHCHRLCLMLGFMFVLLLAGCKITGTVSKDGVALEGATVVLAGDMDARTLTDENGEYAFEEVPAGQFTVTLLPPEGFSGKAVRSVFKATDNANVTDVNFTMDSSTVKVLENGPVIGTRDENGVAVWQGIPFAQPPTGNLRWKAPVPVEDWGDNPYMAVSPCEPCTQYSGMITDGPQKYWGTIIGSEDCLYLNVWAPESEDDDRRPVMFWIHGGGNTVGEAAPYNGRILAERYGVIVVTVNYRLGPMGWFAHPALNAFDGSEEDRSGNYGTLDLIRALAWVQENIAAFGGDKDNVMVFGESAGGLNTLSLMASPLAEGLFHKAAVQSGVLDWIAKNSAWQTLSRSENYEDDEFPGISTSSREVVNDLLVANNLAWDRDSAKVVQNLMGKWATATFLRSLPAEEILSMYPYDASMGGIIFMPTVIRDGLVIPDTPPL